MLSTVFEIKKSPGVLKYLNVAFEVLKENGVSHCVQDCFTYMATRMCVRVAACIPWVMS